MPTIKELKEQRASAHEKMHNIVQVAEARSESPEFTEEERTSYNALKESYIALDARVKLQEDSEARAAAIAESHGGANGDGSRGIKPEERAKAHNEAVRKAFLDVVAGKRAKADLSPEVRAEIFTGAGENQVVVPKLIADKVEVALRETGDFLGAVDTIVTQNGDPLTLATINGTAKKLTKIAEGATPGSEKVQFEGVTLSAYTYATPIFPISTLLMEDAAVDVEAVVINIIVDCIKEGLKELMTSTGTGNNDVKALVKAAPVGATASAADAVSYSDLVSLRASINNVYGRSGVGKYMMNSNTMAACLKIIDTTGRPIFAESVVADQPDRLLGREVIINEYMPDIAAGAIAVAFGDFKAYKLRIVKDFRLIFFNEKYADKLQIGVMGYVRADGNLVDAGTHPIKTLKLKTA